MPKKIERGGGPLEICFPKKLEGWTLWSRPVLYVTRETFLVQFPGPTGAI